MVKLSGFADEIAADAKEQIATLKETGVQYLELRGVGGKGVLDLSPEEVAAFKGQLDEAGIGVSSIGSPIGKVQIRSDLEAHFARFETAVQRAAIWCSCTSWRRHGRYWIHTPITSTSRTRWPSRGELCLLGEVTRACAGFLSLEPHLKADDPEHGGTGPERFATAVSALRQVLDGAGIEDD